MSTIYLTHTSPVNVDDNEWLYLSYGAKWNKWITKKSVRETCAIFVRRSLKYKDYIVYGIHSLTEDGEEKTFYSGYLVDGDSYLPMYIRMVETDLGKLSGQPGVVQYAAHDCINRLPVDDI